MKGERVARGVLSRDEEREDREKDATGSGESHPFGRFEQQRGRGMGIETERGSGDAE